MDLARTIKRTRLAIAILAVAPLAHAAEHITLANGSELDCARHERAGDKVRIYTSGENYLEVPATSVVKVETLPDPPTPSAPIVVASIPSVPIEDIHQLLTQAGAHHNIDSELLASVVHAESNGHTRAVSRTGARGLMQLMPGTAAELCVKDAFIPAQNVEGGTAYLDALLTRYHDNVSFALAAYNAGPAAVDRYHGIPPFHETRAYVARIIHEFNRRKSAGLLLNAQAQAKNPSLKGDAK